MNSFRGADINTGFTVHAHVLVHFCLLVLQRDRGCRALIHTGFAPGTLRNINNSYQLIHSLYYFIKYKK